MVVPVGIHTSVHPESFLKNVSTKFMSDQIFAIIIILAGLSIAYLRESMARGTVRQFEASLERRKNLGFKDEFNKSKMLKDLERAAFFGGIAFSIIGTLLLAGMIAGLFVEVNPEIATGTATTSPWVSSLKQIWNYFAQILMVGIFVYVLYWYGFFKWPWY